MGSLDSVSVPPLLHTHPGENPSLRLPVQENITHKLNTTWTFPWEMKIHACPWELRFTARKITIINSARGVSVQSFCCVLKTWYTFISTSLDTHFLSEAGRDTPDWQTALCLVGVYLFPLGDRQTDRQTVVVDRTTDKFVEIWLQKPGGLWPGPARLLFLPNKRIRRINAHKYLWA